MWFGREDSSYIQSKSRYSVPCVKSAIFADSADRPEVCEADESNFGVWSEKHDRGGCGKAGGT